MRRHATKFALTAILRLVAQLGALDTRVLAPCHALVASGEHASPMRHAAANATTAITSLATQLGPLDTRVLAPCHVLVASGEHASPMRHAINASMIRHRHALQVVPLAVGYKPVPADSGAGAHARFHAKLVIAAIILTVPSVILPASVHQQISKVAILPTIKT
jgi:hypothetical protein